MELMLFSSRILGRRRTQGLVHWPDGVGVDYLVDMLHYCVSCIILWVL